MRSETPAIFIGGVGRSGTTLLVDLLGLHTKLSPLYETYFVTQLAGLLFLQNSLSKVELHTSIKACVEAWTKPLPHQPHNKRAHERYIHGPHHILFSHDFAMECTDRLLKDLSKGDILKSFRSFMDTLFGEHARKNNKPIWVNKTPEYITCLPLLRLLYPSMRFIHCVRDGRDVACSAMTRSWGPKNVRDAALWWKGLLQHGQAFQQRFPTQLYVLRYEDLLAHPQQELGKLLSWLAQEPQEDEMLRLHTRHCLGLQKARMGTWRSTWSPAQIQEFESIAGESLMHFGYPCNSQIEELPP